MAGGLRSKPGQPVEAEPSGGLLSLDGSSRGPALLYVPEAASTGPVPLAVMLHGAGGLAQQSIHLVQHHADTVGFIVLAPTSMEPTWDIIAQRRYGVDSEALDALLDTTFQSYNVDPARLAIAGFSDGASYALSLGLTNGRLFSHVIAFSPGFMAPSQSRGMAKIFMSHGTGDAVLPIDKCSRRIEGQLRAAGYEIDYREFDGGHIVPDPTATAFFSTLARKDELRSR